MSVHSAHLKDDQLVERYMTVRGGDSADPRVADHLSCCSDCAAAYDQLADALEGLRDTAEAELDELFPAERMLAQRQGILRRLEQVHRSARVISFPGHEPEGTSKLSNRLTPRWTAVGAAACLILGLGVGAFIGPDPLHRNAPRSPVAAPAPAPEPPAVPVVVLDSTDSWTAPDDDEFLNQLEFALARPHTRELLPFDALTPHVRDIDVSGR